MKLLRKISWKTRRWNLKISLFELALHDNSQCWGFSLLRITNNYNSYSLLEYEFRLPNGAERNTFQITNWDVLFFKTPLIKWYLNIDENLMWGCKPTKIEMIAHSVLSKVFK